ncbi:MAG TPA: hypothetical protein VJU16_07395, partial [Planctomycetota bacterium]|nr:hypothetical protein [Planctomycetota bacterium]
MTRPWRFAALVLASLALAATQEGYDKLAPFSGVRWNGDEPVVEIGGSWFTLDSIDGTPAKEIVEFCKKTWPDKWKQRFGEDLVEALSRMGKAPGEKVDLKVKETLTGKERLFPAVRMTKENRKKIWSGGAALVFTRAHAQEDLAQLRTHLEECFSYLTVKGFDWKKALLDIDIDLPEKPTREEFALSLMRFLARFGDGHSGLEAEPITAGFTPFLIGDAGGRLVAFQPDRKDFFREGFPYIREIDG